MNIIQRFNDLNIKNKISLAMGTVILLLIILGGLEFSIRNEIKHKVQNISKLVASPASEDLNTENIANSLDTVLTNLNIMTIEFAVFLIMITVIAVLSVLWLKIALSDPLENMTVLIRKLANGDMSAKITNLDRNDEIGKMSNSLLAIRESGITAAQLKSAINNIDTGIIVSDISGKIEIFNDEVVHILKHHLNHLQFINKDIHPDLLGKNINQFKNDPKQSNLELITTSATHTLENDNVSLSIFCAPVKNDMGERVGTVIEIIDKTVDINTQKEVNLVTQNAANGDLSQRISLENKEGRSLIIAENLNNFLDRIEGVFNNLADAQEKLAQGDLRARLEGDYHGKFEEIKNNTNLSIEKLSETIASVIQATLEINVASDDVAKGTQDLSMRTEQQATNVEETAASMEELSSTVRNNANNAQEATTLAETNKEIADCGGKLVHNAVQAMQRIESSSAKISEIISVIDEITFQTNLLALNAAVEAARAGDAGKGFAVVADEVRNLAQRSGVASKEIKNLIVTSTSEVKDGVSLVNQTGDSLAQIVGAAQNVATIIQDIAKASREQTIGIDQINAAVNQMDEMTQQNAAMVQQSASASDSLKHQSEKLTQLIKYFKIDDDLLNNSRHHPVPDIKADKEIEEENHSFDFDDDQHDHDTFSFDDGHEALDENESLEDQSFSEDGQEREDLFDAGDNLAETQAIDPVIEPKKSKVKPLPISKNNDDWAEF